VQPPLAPNAAVGRIAVAGATGYIGARLVPRLLGGGRRVRCLVRAPRKLADRPWIANPAVEVITCDLDDAGAVEEALAGCDVLYYLVHGMQSAGRDYANRDRAMAGTVSRAARSAGVGRIVYLGGLGSSDADSLSEHLASRREVERVLAESGVPLTTFRAAMIIGSGSASFEILRYLTERLPMMITPKWVSTPCQPIAVRDVLHYLVACLDVPATTGRTLEIGGPDVVAYADLIQRMAAARGLPKRRIVPVPLFTPRLSSLWIHIVTPVDAAIARPLAEGLRNPVVVHDHTAATLMPQPLLSVSAAIELALAAESRADIESTWTAAGPIPGDPDWAGGKVFEDRRERFVAAAPAAVFAAVATLGGRRGWYRYNRLWLTRGILDRLIGGPGWQRARRHPTELAWGDVVGFWRVVAVERPTALALRAEMRVPGDAVLEFRIAPAVGADGQAGSIVVQTARFRPRGLLGLFYWYGVAPFHGLVFSGLLDGIAQAAVAPPTPAVPAP
jgi:uncharacterized protein YbjT (DUF2867 family)